MNPKGIFGAALMLVGQLAGGYAAADAPPTCERQLSVELTPGVPNPRDLAFLSSLLTQPGFQLAWRGQNGSLIELELTGPGPDDQCRAVIAAMRKDSRVQSVTVHHDGG
jgi:hypothetical protein